MPFFLRAGIREAYTLALTRIRDTRQASANERVQAWKLFVLTSRMLLYKPSTKGKEGKEILLDRLKRFFRGDWISLLNEARQNHSNRERSVSPSEEEVQMQRRESAFYNVQRGELSKARRILTAAALAPGTSETLGQLTDPARRPPHL